MARNGSIGTNSDLVVMTARCLQDSLAAESKEIQRIQRNASFDTNQSNK